MAQQQHSQPLPSKEQGLFKQLVRFYEEKQHKKAIKSADAILKKFPDHGETLAMKGLTVSNLGPERKEEAYELVRRGLKADLKSHVCWHVYGLLYRADRDYREAIKCYLNALRLDNDNLQILRDLATLQVHIRDLSGFIETRQKLLNLKSNNRSHWITLALAFHASNQCDMAAQVVSAYEGTLTEVPASEAYEHSELLLYKASLLDQAGRLDEALTLLDTSKDKLKDKLSMLEHRASLLLRLGRAGDAEAQYRALLQTNPDHYRWHEGLQASLGLRPPAAADGAGGTPAPPAVPGAGLTPEQRQQLARVYEELAGSYASSLACRRIPLDFLEGAAFAAAADAYARKFIRKGIPSLFIDLRSLYADAAKAQALGALFEGYDASLQQGGALPPLQLADGAAPATNGAADAPESPQVRVWVLYYLAQHYDRLGDPTKGLELVEEALRHTPTLVELYTLKSKLLRHAGDAEGAAHAAETARRADLSDRYLNSMAVKALLRAGKVDAAEKTAALFVKDGDQASGIAYLHDMQHMWFECAAGRAHLRRQEFGKALKRYTAVVKHFEDIHDDQYDFHGYCVRKTTLRAYVAMLRMEDQLFGHPYYLKGALGAIRTYLALADRPSTAQQEADEEALLASMSPEERKKYKLKRKKEEKNRAREAEEAAAKAAEAAKESGKKKNAGQAAAAEKKDPDPDGAKLAAVEDPLAEAAKLVVSLKQHAAQALDTHLLAAEVYARRGRLLLALAGVQQAVRLAGAAHPDVHKALVKVSLRAVSPPPAPAAGQPVPPAPHATVSRLIEEAVAGLLGVNGAPTPAAVASYHAAWAKAHGGASLAHGTAAVESSALLQSSDVKAQAEQLVVNSDLGPTTPHRHEECVAAAQLLDSAAVGGGALAERWRSKCAAAFPFSRFFNGARAVTLEEYEFDRLTEAFGKLDFT